MATGMVLLCSLLRVVRPWCICKQLLFVQEDINASVGSYEPPYIAGCKRAQLIWKQVIEEGQPLEYGHCLHNQQVMNGKLSLESSIYTKV